MDISSLIPLVLPAVPGCLDMAIEQALVDTAREFCERSRVVRLLDSRTVPGSSVTSGEVDLSFTLPTYTEVDMVLQAKVNNRDMQPLRVIDFDDLPSGALGWSFVDSDTLRFQGVSGSDFSLKTVLILKPTLDAVVFPDDLARFQDALSEGAKSKLLIDNKATWYNPQLAGVSAAKFEDGVATACLLVARKFSNAPLRTRSGGYF
jgi:hypothetical protein